METTNEPTTKIVAQVQSGRGHISRWQADNGLFVYSQGVTSGDGYPSGQENLSELDVNRIANSLSANEVDPKIVESQRKLEAKFGALSAKQ